MKFNRNPPGRSPGIVLSFGTGEARCGVATHQYVIRAEMASEPSARRNFVSVAFCGCEVSAFLSL